MAIRFGSPTGYQTKTDYRVSEGELDCGTTVHMFIKNIEKSLSFTDEMSICSIGVKAISGTDMCYENASLKIREESAPKYKPIASALGQDAAYLASLGELGQASTELACVPLKIKNLTVELSATYKEMDEAPTPEMILDVVTSDEAHRLGDFFNLPSAGYQIVTTATVDQPQDDFGSRTITYTKKIAYPDAAVRAVYLTGIDTYHPTFDSDRSTVEREVQFRQGDVPSVTATVTEYGVASVSLT